MKSRVRALVLLGLVTIASTAAAEPTIYFQEEFNGPSLDPSVWRTEILTSGARWCADNSGPSAPGVWIPEGADCHGTAAHSPYGTAALAGGVLSLSSTNVHAFPWLASRLPGSVPLFPATGAPGSPSCRRTARSRSATIPPGCRRMSS